MNTHLPKPILVLLTIGLLFSSSCKKNPCAETMTYKTYVPVYMSFADLRKAVRIGAAQPLYTPGKIYLKGNYIFVNELNKGIHVIDNTNPSSPQNIAFITIPGNVDIAATGNVLYADSYTDLLSFDISNPSGIKLVNRVQNAISYYFACGSSSSPGFYGYFYGIDSTQGVPIGWKQASVTQNVSADCNGKVTGGPIMFEDYNGAITGAPTTGGTVIPQTSGNVTPSSPGTGGSTARFAITNNTLYLVDNSSLHVYDITSNTNPQKVNDNSVGWSVETIFPYKNHLFIGSSSGVYIYDITNPQSPVYISEYDHMTACDPVVVDDQYAYFTLNDDAPCHMGYNQLEVVDITNINSPTLKVTVPLTDPKGLGIDSKTLFICDSKAGLKVFNASDVTQIASNEIASFPNISAFDVIPYNKHLLMIGSDGLYQYDYSNIQNITLLSKIPVGK